MQIYVLQIPAPLIAKVASNTQTCTACSTDSIACMLQAKHVDALLAMVAFHGATHVTCAALAASVTQ